MNPHSSGSRMCQSTGSSSCCGYAMKINPHASCGISNQLEVVAVASMLRKLTHALAAASAINWK
eukprot:2038605-Ditylum_brightwellii.AAC.1